MLTEIIEYNCKIKKEVKAIQKEMKKNIQGTNSKGKETWTQINDLEQKKEISIQPEQNEEIRIKKKKMRRGLGTSATTLNILTPKSQKCQKEKRKSKKLKTYLKK